MDVSTSTKYEPSGCSVRQSELVEEAEEEVSPSHVLVPLGLEEVFFFGGGEAGCEGFLERNDGAEGHPGHRGGERTKGGGGADTPADPPVRRCERLTRRAHRHRPTP